MIDEARRRLYLSAMQVANWLPRVNLPFAPPARPLWQPEVEPPAVDAFVSLPVGDEPPPLGAVAPLVAPVSAPRPRVEVPRPAAQARAGGKLPTVLRVDLEEFSHVFTSATESVGLVRLRATLSEPAQTGETLLGQRVFIVQRPASSADAAGGTRALAEATHQVAQELARWVEQPGR